MLEKRNKIRSTFIMPAIGGRNENTFGSWCQTEERLNFHSGQQQSDPKEDNYYPPRQDASINRGYHLRGMASSHYR